jgi:protein gp37
LLPERLNAPFWVRKPGRVFVCSMADLGHPKVPPEWHSLVWRMMRLAPWHTYILLTKRPGEWMSEAPVGTWLGVTVENETAQWRLMRLKEVAHYAWYVRFVSVEPMLGPVSFASHVVRPDWVIAGPETGPKARRCDDAWIEKLAAESPCFFDKREGRRRRREWPEGEMVRVEDAQ